MTWLALVTRDVAPQGRGAEPHRARARRRGGGRHRRARGAARARAAGVVTPPSLAHGDGPALWLVLFGFAQLVHDGLWCWHLPRFHDAPWRTAAGSVLCHATAARLAAVGAAAALGLLVTAAVTSGTSARALYQVAAAYHVVVEAPRSWLSQGARLQLAPVGHLSEHRRLSPAEPGAQALSDAQRTAAPCRSPARLSATRAGPRKRWSRAMRAARRRSRQNVSSMRMWSNSPLRPTLWSPPMPVP